MAKQPDGNRLWQIVWKVVFDDEDSEEKNRLELIAAMKLYCLRESKYLNKSQAVMQSSVDDDASVSEDGIADHAIPSLETDFIDPRY